MNLTEEETDERARIAVLMACGVLDTDPESGFDDIAAVAQSVCEVPIALVSLSDRDRQFFKARLGFDQPEVAKDIAFCPYALRQTDILVVPDTRLDPRFAENPLVTPDDGIRFYAGAQVTLSDGVRVGTLCVLDRRPRILDEQQLDALRRLATQVAAQLDLRRARADAEAANRAKSEFLSRMSHELRTPLNAILGFAQLLEMDELDAEQRDSLAHITGAGRHLLELISEILDLARIEAGHLSLTIDDVELGEVVTTTAGLLRPLADQRGISVTSELEAPAARADAQRLRQVLLNLVGNAVKYNCDGGRVVIRTTEDADVVAIEVTDDGPGIPQAARDRLFEPFERLGAERGTVEGTGLGLSVSLRLVEAMAGTLTVEPRPGGGTSARVTLPKSSQR